MKNNPKLFGLATISILLVWAASGCSYVGYKAGKSIGENQKGYAPVTIEESAKLKRGTPVRITFKSDKVIEGRFAGIEVLRPDSYGLAFAEYQARCGGKINLPRPGDTVRVVGFDGSEKKVEFWGVDRDRVNILPLADSSHCWLQFSVFRTLAFGPEASITSDSLEILADLKAFPIMTTLAVDDAYFTNLAALQEIKSVEKGRDATAFKMGGFLGGLVADIIIWSLAASSF